MKVKVGHVSKLYSLILEDYLRYQCLTVLLIKASCFCPSNDYNYSGCNINFYNSYHKI